MNSVSPSLLSGAHHTAPRCPCVRGSEAARRPARRAAASAVPAASRARWCWVGCSWIGPLFDQGPDAGVSALPGADFRPPDVSPAWARVDQPAGQGIPHPAAADHHRLPRTPTSPGLSRRSAACYQRRPTHPGPTTTPTEPATATPGETRGTATSLPRTRRRIRSTCPQQLVLPESSVAPSPTW